MFIKNYPAMKIGKTLVIADLHIGITRELRQEGITIPSQVEPFLTRIKKLLKITKAERLIIIGDVKHEVPGTSFQETREIPEFFSMLEHSVKKITVVKGNHDSNIEKIVPGNVKIKKYVKVDSYLLTHGHRNLPEIKARTVVIGHIHQCVRFRDRLGSYYSESVWLKCLMKNGENLIVMPPFNELVGFSTVNRSSILGPVTKNIVKESVHAYLLDGTDIGKIKDLVVV